MRRSCSLGPRSVAGPPGGDAEQALPDEPLRTIQETRQELSADSEGRGRWAA